MKEEVISFTNDKVLHINIRIENGCDWSINFKGGSGSYGYHSIAVKYMSLVL